MRLICGIAAIVMAATAAGAMDVVMDRASVDAAVTMGQSRSERDRMRYHADYRSTINKAPIDYVEIVTPFRRVVLAAEAQARAGDRRFGQRQALELLAAADGQVDILVELTFHPQNTYVGVPEYTIRLEERGGRLATSAISPQTFERMPRYGVRVDGIPLGLAVPGAAAGGQSQPLLGGTVVAHFDGNALNPVGTYEVIVEEAGKELGRARADFAKLR
jgi:hypothetical protein